MFLLFLSIKSVYFSVGCSKCGFVCVCVEGGGVGVGCFSGVFEMWFCVGAGFSVDFSNGWFVWVMTRKCHN